MASQETSSPDSSHVAVIGLGLMGSRMAKRLIDHGLSVGGYDPDPQRLAEFEAAGGDPAASPADAAQGRGAVLLSLPDSDIAREVCLGPDGLMGSGAGSLVVYDTTTGRPSDAVAIASALAEAGITYCDTTVSGNSQLAESGELVVMVGGPHSAFTAGVPIFEAIGRSHHHMGEIGSGATMKLLVNQTLTIHRMALAETLVVAQLGGLDLETTLDVLKDGLSYSKAMDLWGPRMITGEHEPPFSRLRQSSKDARLIVDHGHRVHASIPLVEVVAAALAEGEAGGLGDMDNSSIVEVVRRRAGIGTIGSQGSEDKE